MLSYHHWREADKKHCSLTIYGAKVDQLHAKVGEAVKPADLEAALKAKNYKLVTITHVDTSTGTFFGACATVAC